MLDQPAGSVIQAGCCLSPPDPAFPCEVYFNWRVRNERERRIGMNHEKMPPVVFLIPCPCWDIRTSVNREQQFSRKLASSHWQHCLQEASGTFSLFSPGCAVLPLSLESGQGSPRPRETPPGHWPQPFLDRVFV